MAEPLAVCTDDKLLVKRGRNRWIIARTDRDSQSDASMIQTVGAFLSRIFGEASPIGTANPFDILQDPDPEPGSLAAWYLGAARPVLVKAMFHQEFPPVETEGQRLGRSTECAPPRAVATGDGKPFYFVVEFDWRGPDKWIPWPARKIALLGYPESNEAMDLDWLLVSAHFLSPEAQSPDSGIGEEIGEAVAEKAGEIAEAVGDTGKKVLFAAVGVLVAVVVFKVATNDGRARRAY